MSSITPITTRTSALLRSDTALNQLQRTRQEMFQAQQQISTGKRYNRPSDAPARISTILHLKQQLEARGQYERNLDHAKSVLNTADQALGEATDLMREAKSIASSQIGVGSDAGTREAEAQVIDAKIDSLLEIANRQFDGQPVFGGDAGSGADGRVFEAFRGGIRYTGTTQALKAEVGEGPAETFNTHGDDAFGALSARIKSEVDLQPQPAADTRIDYVAGAQGQGVRQGSVQLNVDGTTTTVDLGDIDTLGDVTTRLNDAIDNIDATAGSLAISGNGFQLNANAGHSITVDDVQDGQTAADLGISLSASGGSTSGPSVRTELAPSTKLSDLGASVDFASGLQITQGQTTKTVDFSGDTTIEDMQSSIESLDLGLRLQINENKDGLNLVSDVAGLELSVGENGGTTGQDLGLLSFGTQTQLSSFRHGKGVDTEKGEDDLAFSLHDGTSFTVNLDGAQTVDDVITEVENAATSAGLTLGTDFSIGLANNGTGFRLEDNTAGGNDFEVSNASHSLAANHLGLAQNAGGANTLNGEDNAKVRVDNAFTHLMNLRDSLKQNDEDGITFAGSGLEDDLDQVVQARGRVGAQAKRIEDLASRSKDQELTEQKMLSELEDADMTEVITRFTQLQQQLQASLRVSGQTLQQSLLDFLR